MRNREYWGATLLAVGFLAGCDRLLGMKSSFTVERAKVEQVLQTESDGYRFVAFVVSWRAVQIVVSDPLAKSHHREDDEIRFMAQRIELPGGSRSLSFTLAEP
jgi:hypothetical protein